VGEKGVSEGFSAEDMILILLGKLWWEVVSEKW